ncbi:MAG: HPF/RaiA family ribosome-associated protein [Spirochaetales bacterium]|nr:HPF/RaiA family ribosome-associated protein [Spirochaetales bacterium]
MNIDIRGVHYDISDIEKQTIDRKLHKIDFIKEKIIDIIFTIIKEKKDFKLEVSIYFQWGTSAHLHVRDFDVLEGIDKLFNKMEVKIHKEKEKIQEHK